MEPNKFGIRSNPSSHSLFGVFLVWFWVSIWGLILPQLSTPLIWMKLTFILPCSGGIRGWREWLGPGWLTRSISLISLIGPRIGSRIMLSLLVSRESSFWLWTWTWEDGKGLKLVAVILPQVGNWQWSPCGVEVSQGMGGDQSGNTG